MTAGIFIENKLREARLRMHLSVCVCRLEGRDRKGKKLRVYLYSDRPTNL